MEEESWRRNLGRGIIDWRHLEASASVWEVSGRPLGNIWEASGGNWEAAGGSPGPPWFQKRLGGKMCQNHCVLLS